MRNPERETMIKGIAGYTEEVDEVEDGIVLKIIERMYRSLTLWKPLPSECGIVICSFC